MTPRDPPEGSSLYYALWGMPDDRRERVLARLALGDALHDATQDVTHPDVAHRKVHWWHEELQRLHDGVPRHPICVANRDLARSSQAMERALDVLGASTEERLDPAETDAQLDERLNRGGAARAWLALQGSDSERLDGLPDVALADVANGLARHERLARMAQLLNQSQPVFALEHYRAFSATPADIGSSDGEARARSTRLVEAAIATARQRIARGLDALSTSVPRGEPARALLVLARLRDAQLALWERHSAELVRVRPSLTPIRKLFIAWRTR